MATQTAYKAVKPSSYESPWAVPPHTYTVGASVSATSSKQGNVLYCFTTEAAARAYAEQIGGSLRIVSLSYDDVTDVFAFTSGPFAVSGQFDLWLTSCTVTADVT